VEFERFKKDFHNLRKGSEKHLNEVRPFISQEAGMYLQFQHNAMSAESYMALHVWQKALKHVITGMDLWQSCGFHVYLYHIQEFPTILAACGAWEQLKRFSTLVSYYPLTRAMLLGQMAFHLLPMEERG